jgi:hypothetical protein
MLAHKTTQIMLMCALQININGTCTCSHVRSRHARNSQGYDDEDADDTSEDGSSGTPSPQASRKYAGGGRTLNKGSRRGSGRNDAEDTWHASVAHSNNGDGAASEAAKRDTFGGSVRSDVLAALQLVEGAHKVRRLPLLCVACRHVLAYRWYV